VKTTVEVAQQLGELTKALPLAPRPLLERYACRVQANLDNREIVPARIEAVSSLVEMGFDMLKCCRAVEHCNNDLIRVCGSRLCVECCVGVCARVSECVVVLFRSSLLYARPCR
jgi:UBA/TS-N domain